jgi:transposase
MTTTTANTTTAVRPILAIDLGKYKCVACIYERATGAAQFRSIDTSLAEVERLIPRTRPSVVVIEACALTAYRQADELVARAEAKLDQLGKTSPAVRLLDTMPGLGPRTTETVVAHLADPRRLKSGKQVGAYGGLVPRHYQLGEDDRRGRISKRGPAVLRKLLVQCAWAMLRYNPWARAVYDRLCRGKARKKQAIIALARKILIRCWAMLRDGAAWRADPVPAAAA